ncbi:serine/threonine kinase receptor associated protein-like protein [Myriangium duriaei CBS 260.36]|uniref:Serine-threonine kinase receptor-associated protein n=1 Tax=Myriangium duriaei CBS 260.36 TaxID=1168546 RepID=A0A9P4IZV2_9PEZI|nr:serine/threonine kinase receptor associated protein-like protein [Myriangium duriaei CBS 260.36]
MTDSTRVVPLTCHGHSRPITHLTFSSLLPSHGISPSPSPVGNTSSTSAPSSSSSSTPSYFLLSACKDQNPMLRDGATGDWIGTFLGHKGAVWSARLAPDASLAVTGSADFTARVWDTFTGECVAQLPESHIVRAVGVSGDGRRVATGGMEKKVKVWDVRREEQGGPGEAVEVGRGVHGGTVKSLLWTRGEGENGLVSAADDKRIRWWDLRTQKVVAEVEVDGPIGSCELNDVGEGQGMGTLSVAAGKNVYFFDGKAPGRLLKHVKMQKEVASVAVNSASGRFVTGSSADTWVRVWDLETEEELETGKGHHGPVWTVSFSPDGKLYATGSEDGTIKLWKATREPYGLWR